MKQIRFHSSNSIEMFLKLIKLETYKIVSIAHALIKLIASNFSSMMIYLLTS